MEATMNEHDMPLRSAPAPSLPDAASTSASLSPAIERVAASAHQAVDRLAGAASSAMDSFRSSGAGWKESGEHTLQSVESCVREHPLLCVGAAVAAGFVLSRMVR